LEKYITEFVCDAVYGFKNPQFHNSGEFDLIPLLKNFIFRNEAIGNLI